MQRERGRIVCPECGTELEVTRASAALQVVVTVVAAMAVLAVVPFMQRHNASRALGVVFAVVIICSAGVLAYLFLSRFRVEESLSVRADSRLDRRND